LRVYLKLECTFQQPRSLICGLVDAPSGGTAEEYCLTTTSLKKCIGYVAAINLILSEEAILKFYESNFTSSNNFIILFCHCNTQENFNKVD
jgi:hypothetical protein